MRPVLIWQIFTLELRKILSYRIDFWASFLGTVLVEFAMAYFLWNAVYEFREVKVLNGFSFPAMMLYYLLIPVISHITQAQVMHFISQEIYDGSLNRYLVYPLSFFGFKFIGHLAFGFVGILQLFLVMGLYLAFFDLPDDVSLSSISLMQCVFTAIIGSVLYFLMASCLEMVAFWAENIWSLLVMLKLSSKLLGGGLIPLTFFPDWSITILKFLPVYSFTALPVEVALGQTTGSEWFVSVGVAIIWIMFFSVLAGFIWRRGKLHYTGVGI